MKEAQIKFGEERLRKVATAWGVTNKQAVRILSGKEFIEFWKWVDADEFLNMGRDAAKGEG